MLIYASECLFTLWILRWGGAEWCAHFFRAIFIIDWFAGHWNAEQIKLYVLIVWFASTIWFALGLFNPALRPTI